MVFVPEEPEVLAVNQVMLESSDHLPRAGVDMVTMMSIFDPTIRACL